VLLELRACSSLKFHSDLHCITIVMAMGRGAVQGNYENGLVYVIILFLTFWILFSYLVPISLFVTLEIVKFILVRPVIAASTFPLPCLWQSRDTVICSTLASCPGFYYHPTVLPTVCNLRCLHRYYRTLVWSYTTYGSLCPGGLQ
jgi:hypothetical protein